MLGQQQFAGAEELLAGAARECPKTAAIFDALGLSYDFQGHSKQAQSAFHQAIALDAKVAGFHDNLAASLIRSGSASAGIAEFHKALALEPSNQTANLNLAALSLAAKRYGAALRFLKAAHADSSQDPSVLLQLVECYFATGDSKAGGDTARHLASFPELEPAIRFSLGLQLAEHGDYELAAPQFAAIPPADRDVAADLNLGMAYSKLGRFAEARAAYDAALRLDPSNPEAFLHIGLDVAQTGDENAALDWMTQASGKAPGRVDIECALVQQLIRVGNFERAQDLLAQALASHKNDPDLSETQGDLLLREGHPDQAAEVYRELLVAQPRRASARISLAKAYQQLQQNDRARHELETALRADTGSAEARAQLGHLELASGRQDAAEEAIKQALAADPSNLTANEDRAVLLVRAGRFSEAESLLHRLAKLDPRNPQIHYQLGKVLAQLQRPDEAQAEFGLSKELQTPQARHTP